VFHDNAVLFAAVSV